MLSNKLHIWIFNSVCQEKKNQSTRKKALLWADHSIFVDRVVSALSSVLLNYSILFLRLLQPGSSFYSSTQKLKEFFEITKSVQRTYYSSELLIKATLPMVLNRLKVH